MAANNTHPFKKMLNFQMALFKRLPLRVSQWALLEIKENFAREGYINANGSFVPWKKRKENTWKKTNSDSGRALLVLTSRLKRSLKADPLYHEARVVTDVEYAQTHQNGFKGVIVQRIGAFNRRKMGKFGVIKTTSLKKSTRVTFGKGQVGQSKVKPHTRRIKVDIPARPFMEVGGPALQKWETKILTEIEQLFLKS